MHPKITILITCYNKQHSIKETINSVVNQSISKETYEILVIDDCSNDNSIKEIRKFTDISLHQNEQNKGVLKSIFIGLEKAQGSIIILLDGDDLLAWNAIEILSKFLFKNPNCALYSKCQRFNNKAIELQKKPIKNYEVTKVFNYPINIIRFNKTGTPALAFYKKDLLIHKYSVPPVLIQDHIIPAMLAKNIKKFYFIDALTHIAINWDSDTHITSNTAQLEHDRLEFFWQCIQSERFIGNSLFDFYFRIVLLKKIFKRNKKYKLQCRLSFSKMLRGLFDINQLEALKNDAMVQFRKNYKIKFYG